MGWQRRWNQGIYGIKWYKCLAKDWLGVKFIWILLIWFDLFETTFCFPDLRIHVLAVGHWSFDVVWAQSCGWSLAAWLPLAVLVDSHCDIWYLWCCVVKIVWGSHNSEEITEQRKGTNKRFGRRHPLHHPCSQSFHWSWAHSKFRHCDARGAGEEGQSRARDAEQTAENWWWEHQDLFFPLGPGEIGDLDHEGPFNMIESSWWRDRTMRENNPIYREINICCLVNLPFLQLSFKTLMGEVGRCFDCEWTQLLTESSPVANLRLHRSCQVYLIYYDVTCLVVLGLIAIHAAHYIWPLPRTNILRDQLTPVEVAGAPDGGTPLMAAMVPPERLAPAIASLVSEVDRQMVAVLGVLLEQYLTYMRRCLHVIDR